MRLRVRDGVRLSAQEGGRGDAPPPRDRSRRLVAAAVSAAVVVSCILATLAPGRDPTPRFPAPFRPVAAVGYDAHGRAVEVPSGTDRLLIYVSDQCRYCRDELAAWDAVMRVTKGHGSPTVVLSPGSVATASWLPPGLRGSWIHDRDGAAARALGVRGVPFVAVVGQDGRVLEAWAGVTPRPRLVPLLSRLSGAPEVRP